MEAKEWFNLSQICRNRFTRTHNDSKCSLSCCKRGVAMCCRKAGVVGIVGAVLVVLGLIHLVAGIYFMLVLPMFHLGSNLWTGAWCGICGVILGTIGWKQQTMRKGQVILVASLSVLVVEVANLVIIQVGEYRVFLSDNDRRVIVEDNQDLTMQIAFWLTTLVTALGIVVSFFGAQYLFCVVIRGPRVKGRMPITRSLSEEDLQHRQVHVTRFKPPSLEPNADVDTSTLAVGSSLGYGSQHVHENSGSGGGGNTVSNNKTNNNQNQLRVVISREGDENEVVGQTSQQASTSTNSERRQGSVQQDMPSTSSKNQAPKTPEESVPYFLRNHKSSWQFIIPEVVKEMRESNRFSVADSFCDVHSRTSTLSRASKSSFHPHRPPVGHNGRPDILEVNRRLSVAQEFEMGNINRGGARAPSSCNSSVFSLAASCGGRSGSKSPSGSKIVRPNVPPPAPPTTKSTAALRAASSGGWKTCAVQQYPAEAGGGFVIDLD